MGRKSRAEERRELILAAFERCIAHHGIDVPLEQIADEAGVQRSLIRHHPHQFNLIRLPHPIAIHLIERQHCDQFLPTK